jgi:hypothetical protein
MNKTGYQPLTVLMQSESSGFAWAFTPGRSSPTVIALRILIALCALLPFCAIGFASFTAGTALTKKTIPGPVAPTQSATPAPIPNADDRAAASDSEANRTGAVTITNKSQTLDQPPIPAALPVPVLELPSQPEPTGNDQISAENAPRVAGRFKFEKFRRSLERKRAQLEESYQSHAISAEAYKKGQEKYRGEIARYRRQLNSAVKAQKDNSKF